MKRGKSQNPNKRSAPSIEKKGGEIAERGQVGFLGTGVYKEKSRFPKESGLKRKIHLYSSGIPGQGLENVPNEGRLTSDLPFSPAGAGKHEKEKCGSPKRALSQQTKRERMTEGSCVRKRLGKVMDEKEIRGADEVHSPAVARRG